MRFVSNRSSGKMGFAIARAAWRRGAAGCESWRVPRRWRRLAASSASIRSARRFARQDVDAIFRGPRRWLWRRRLPISVPRHPAEHKVKKDAHGLAAGDGIDRGRDAAAGREEGQAHPDRIRGRNPGPGGQRARQAQAQGSGPDCRQRCDAGGGGLRGRYQYRDAHRRRRQPQSHPQMSKDAVADLILDRIVALRAAKSKPGRAEKSSRLRAVR